MKVVTYKFRNHSGSGRMIFVPKASRKADIVPPLTAALHAALLIALGLAGVSYGKWIRFSWKFQAMNLVLTSIMLLIGLAVGYH